MSFTAFALSVAAVWLAIGIIASIGMRRRGHAFFTWWYLGAVLGPLAVPLAIDAIFRERSLAVTTVSAASKHAGGIAVLAGIDGSAASLAAARAAVALLGDRVERLTLAAVVDYDAVSGGPADRRAQAEGELARAAEALSGVPSERVILVGAPADALASASREGGFDLLVVGSRGRGASRALLGSVASHLARGIGIPVLLGDAPDVGGSKHSAGRDDESAVR
jgi:nucleotide-binding universal stress UspA family protein